MTTATKARLEAAIQKWLDDESEFDNFNTDVYYHEHLVQQMANAAAIVFDSAVDAQIFAEQQKSE